MTAARSEPAQKRLLFLDHLEELRIRIIRSLIVVIIAAFAAFPFADEFLRFLMVPLKRTGDYTSLVFLAPGEAFVSFFILTLWGALVLASPFLLYEIWAFVAGALTEKERRYVFIFWPLSLIFFAAGCAFGYFVVAPVSLKFFLSFSSEVMIPLITVSRYLSFVGSLIVSFGVVFELPLILGFLTRIGVATPAFLSQKRRYAVILIFIVSAVLTPPDVFSQLLMAVPLILLYEAGIVLSRLAYLRKTGSRLQ
jgi:sec-independent protein translocase protein TatC